MQRVKQVIDQKTGEILHSQAIEGNENFLMFFRDKLAVLQTLAATKKGAMALRVFLVIVQEMGRDNVLAASQQTISEYVGCSNPSVSRSFKVLRELGIIETYYVGNIPCVAVNANLVWSTHANGRKYARCQAKLLISDDEQKKPRAKRLTTLSAPAKLEESGQQRLFPESVVQAEATRV